MRREYSKKQGGDEYLEWLRSLGCIIYLPLSSDGDLQDRMSGESLILSGDGSFEWNEAWGGYKMTQPASTGAFVARLNIDFDATLFPEENFTVVYTVQKISNSDNASGFWFASSNNNMTPLFVGYNATSDVNRWDSGVLKVAYITNHTESNRTCVQQGGIYQTYAEYTPYLPSNWQKTSSGIYWGGGQGSNLARSTQFYIKEAYIFNRALSLAEIRQIHGYEPLPF